METGSIAEGRVDSMDYLCLKCRQTGHVVNDCPSTHWTPDEYGWFFSQARKSMSFTHEQGDSQQQLCQRCQDLGILELLRNELPWETSQQFSQAWRDGSDLIISIGHTGSVVFRNKCAMCRCLFALTPHPSSTSQEIYILPHWTMYRLTGENGTSMNTAEKRTNAKCLLVVLKPTSIHLDFSIQAHRGDALCIVEEDDTPSGSTLGGRQIGGSILNTGIIEEWLSTCARLHGPDCMPVFTEELGGVRFIDVESRTVVKCPGKDFEYIALSYVWGGVTQKSFQLGASLRSLPRTIEDAMDYVRILNRRYLWVDSVCIDQSDENDKLDQINRMWSIYRGACITIIALSGPSAEAGLPGLGMNGKRSSQLICHVDGKRLVGLMPTLSQHIWMSPWGSRAWTLQEAILSPRCLYLSDQQLYFECNAMQCCESLDQRHSWAHNLSSLSAPKQEGWLSWVIDQVGPGCLKNPLDSPEIRLTHHGAKVTLYSYRSMTNDTDGLNAFKGILQQLETIYPDGFFWGLPVADFQWALLWQAQYQPLRREGFPTWTWAGWKAGVWPTYPTDLSKPNEFPVDVQIYKAVDSQLVELFERRHDDPQRSSVMDDLFRNDPAQKAAGLDSSDPEFDLSRFPDAQRNGYLFIEAISLQLEPEYSKPLTNTHRNGEFELFIMNVGGTRCCLKIMSTDPEIHAAPSPRRHFLLLARDRAHGWIYHYLLVVYQEKDFAVRRTVMELLVPERHHSVLESLQPLKRRVVVA